MLLSKATRDLWLGTVAPSSKGRMVFKIDRLALTRGQVFRVYFYEKVGARNCEQAIDRSRQYYDRGQWLGAQNVFDVIDVVKDSSLRSE